MRICYDQFKEGQDIISYLMPPKLILQILNIDNKFEKKYKFIQLL